ncbi:putative membrane protein [Sulfurospirillum diekertiae]|uniref:Membrane protein n=2 Tax=Sulfurospirillum diekertiae TaxID=1854492 RepID=A0A1Y0HKV0_9BACT|nr:putative membrane protein [Sulfurospirillum diekertiae]
MFRQVVSLTLLVSLLAVGSSGILMIILNSFEFQFQMHPVHKIFGVLMVLSGSLHLYLNFGSVKKILEYKKRWHFLQEY